MTLVGAIGQCAIVPPEMAGWNAARAVAVIRLADPEDAYYVRLCFLSRPIRHLMDVWANTTVQPTLNLKEIRQLPLPWPPKDERSTIAQIGKAFDDKIELNRRMNETLEATARALFKSWFVDFDPVRARMNGQKPLGMDDETAVAFPSSFKETTLGKIPAGWRFEEVRELGAVICGKTPSTRDATNYGDYMPFITIPDMHGQVFATSTGKILSQQGAESQAKKTLPPGSICVSCIATPGLVVLTSEKSQTNQQINSVVPKEEFGAYYPYYVLRELGDDIRSHGSGGSVFANLSKGKFEQLKILLPPPELMTRFHVAVAGFFDLILANVKESKTLASLRDTLLPKLLSGEIRVGEATKLAEEAA